MNQLIVDTQGAQLRQTGEQLIVQRGEETLQTVPLGSLQQVSYPDPVGLNRSWSRGTALPENVPGSPGRP